MFEGLRNAWARRSWSDAQSAPLKAWAQAQGMGFTPQAGGSYAMKGEWHRQAVRIDCTAPSRPFIQGLELNGRVDLGMSMPGNVVVLNRALKHRLETWASELYAQYTDTLQTTVDSSLPEEMRWLAMYEEMVWPGLPASFREHFAVVAERIEFAQRWIHAPVVSQLLNAVAALKPGVAAQILVQRGRESLSLNVTAAQRPKANTLRMPQPLPEDE